jgi:hypothetical protein
VEKIDFFPATVSFGTEIEARRGLFVRAGFARSEPTMGGGLHFAKWGKESVLDYALVPDPVAPGPTHVFSWSVLL